MIESIKTKEVNKRVKIDIINSGKFKTHLLGLYIVRPLTEKEATMNALLTRLFSRGSQAYPTTKAFTHRLDEMYGSVFSSDVYKYGERIALQLKLQFPSPRLLQEPEMLKENIDFLRQILYAPVAKDGRFKEEYFEQERQQLIDEIEGRINDKVTYAIERCIEVMCAEEPFSIYQYGSVEMAKAITNEEVFAHYQRILAESKIRIVAIGDMNHEVVIPLLEEAFHLEDKAPLEIDREEPFKKSQEVKQVEEALSISQSKLTLGYRTNILVEDALYEASVLFAMILGGGAHSQLFKKVREEKSLCYYIFSKIEKYKSIMLITAGIEDKDRQEVIQLIQEEMDGLLAGNFSDHDIEVAKKAIVTSVRSMADYQNSFINFYFGREITGGVFDEEKIIEDVMKVTKDEIIAAGKHFVLDTIHVLRGEVNEEN